MIQKIIFSFKGGNLASIGLLDTSPNSGLKFLQGGLVGIMDNHILTCTGFLSDGL